MLLAIKTSFPSGDRATNCMPPLLMRSRASWGTRPKYGGGVGARVGAARGKAVEVKVAVGVPEGISVGSDVEVLAKTGVSDFWGEGVSVRSTWSGKQEVSILARASSSNHQSRNFNLFMFAPVKEKILELLLDTPKPNCSIP